MRVLIVGGSAFLGSHVARALLREPRPVSVSVMDLRPYAGPHAEQVQSLSGDVTNPGDCARVLAEAAPDAVVSMVTPDLMRASAEAFQRVNVDGVHALLAACQDHGIRALVYVSSIAVMNHFVEHVDVDEQAPLPPLESYRTPYERSKRLGEEAVLAADAPGGLRTCALRMGGILSDMRDVGLKHLLHPVVVLQGGSRPIDMLYGGDAAHGIVCALRGLLDRPDEVGGEAFFLTKGRSTTSFEYFSWAAERLGRRVYVLPEPVRLLALGGVWIQHQVRRALGRPVPGVPLYEFMRIQGYTQTFDNTKARRILGYAPQGTLRDGVERIVDAHLERTEAEEVRRDGRAVDPGRQRADAVAP